MRDDAGVPRTPRALRVERIAASSGPALRALAALWCRRQGIVGVDEREACAILARHLEMRMVFHTPRERVAVAAVIEALVKGRFELAPWRHAGMRPPTEDLIARLGRSRGRPRTGRTLDVDRRVAERLGDACWVRRYSSVRSAAIAIERELIARNVLPTPLAAGHPEGDAIRQRVRVLEAIGVLPRDWRRSLLSDRRSTPDSSKRSMSR